MPRPLSPTIRRRWRLAFALLTATLHLPAAALEDVPFVRTPAPVVDAILDLAAVGPDDRLLDLGSGDGRIVITAARRFGTRGLGVEIVPSLVEQARREAEAAGVGALARFVTQDLFDTELSGASVVTLYLLPDVNLALRPRLLARLAPGARVVSHDWDMGDWRPDRSVTVAAPGKPVGPLQQSTLHLWVIPAQVDGTWHLEIEGPPGDTRTMRLELRQRFQDLEASARGQDARAPAAGTPAGAGAASAGALAAAPAQGTGRLSGRRIAFELAMQGRRLRFEGLVDGHRMSGRADDGEVVRSWSAVPQPGHRPAE